MNQESIDSGLLLQFSRYLERNMGLCFPAERWPDLIRGAQAAAREHRFEQTGEFIQWLLSEPPSREKIQSLSSRFTVGETYFFRDPAIFALLQSQILPQLIEARRNGEKRLRIWSAGCSTGEETYSIAITVQRAIPDMEKWQVSILGTDINPQALEKAEAGLFGEWSFRSPPEWLKDGYFRKAGRNQYEIISQVCRNVAFCYLNLAESHFPAMLGAADIVFCRNVLMYMSPQRATETALGISRAIVDGGWLVVTPAEASLLPRGALTAVNFSCQTLYRKASVADIPTLRAQNEKAIPERPSSPISMTSRPVSERKRPSSGPMPDENVRAMAMELADRGEFALALQHCEKAIAADRLNPSWHYLMATILQEHGKPDKAVQALKKALYLAPDFVMAHFSLGNLYRQQGRYQESCRYLKNVSRLLRSHTQDEVLPESGGMSTGRLMEMVQGFMDTLEKTA